MTAPAAADRGQRKLKLEPGQVIELDVEYCDLVPSHDGPMAPQFRFKGQLVGRDGRAGELVRFFVDVSMAEEAMRRTGVLLGLLPELPRGEQVVAVPLQRRRLTIRRVDVGRGITQYEIRPREGVVSAEDEQILGDMHWALGSARNHFMPLLRADGHAIGPDEALAIAIPLFHARRADRRRTL